ncbi:MAG: glycosyltransferase [Gammaproteobacteria bacterium]
MGEGLLALPAFLIWLGIILLPWRPWSTRESLDADPALTPDLSRVSVLIPARNEQEVIANTLTALYKQGNNLKIILIDDQSSDETVTIIKGLALQNLQIINGQTVPKDWSGKLWALEQGLSHIDTEFILLLDADIQLQLGTVASLLVKLEQEQLHLVSLMALLRMHSFWEKLLMPAFIYFFKLLYPFRLSNSSSRWTAAAAGGCILMRKSALESIGGFQAVKDSLIDDCALARKIKNNGGKIWIGLTHSALSLRSYENLETIWNMVARTAFTQLRYSVTLLIMCTLLMFIAFVSPFIALLSPVIWAKALALITLIFMFISYLPTLKYYSLNYLWGCCLPFIAMLYLAMTWVSAYRHLFGSGSSWKDRSYPASG